MTWSKPIRARRMRASFSTAGFGDEDHGLAGAEDVAGVLGEATVEPDVDRPSEVPRGERLRRSAVDHDRAVGLVPERCLEVDVEHGVHGRRRAARAPAVRVGGEREVQRCDGLALGHRFDELRPRSWAPACSSCVRCSPIVDSFGGGQVLAARRTRAVRRVHAGRVGEGQELVVHRAVQPTGQLVGRPTDRGQQVGAADVADEQRVAGEHSPRLVVVLVLATRRSRSTRGCGPGCGGSRGSRRRARAAGRAATARSGSRRAASSPYEIAAPVAAASSRWPDRKSAWKWVSITRSIRRPRRSASARYCDSRAGGR